MIDTCVISVCICCFVSNYKPSVFVDQDYDDEPTFTSSIWGPTCDGLDCITEKCFLPELDNGDWIIFRDMGAYTMCAASNFNGMPKPRCYYIIQDSPW